MKKSRAVIVIIVLIGAAISISFLLPFILPNRDPIIIDGNQDFEEQGWPGDGTESNPYVISRLIISQGYIVWEDNTAYTILAEASVFISNTTAHFVISHCTFGGIGVKLVNVENGVIESCSRTKGICDYAVSGYNLRNCTIQNNLFGYCHDYCIMLENGSSNTVAGNTISYTGAEPEYSRCETGIFLSEQSLLNCRSNTISDCDIGIYLRDCSGGRYFHWVSNNFIEKCGTGLVLWSCSNLPVLLNELYNNTEGFIVGSSIAVNFSNNSVSYNSGGGVWVVSSAIGCVLSENDINNNGWSGITFDWVTNLTPLCQALYNDIRNNDGWGIIINGKDNAILTGNTLAGNTLGNTGYNITYPPTPLLATHNPQPRSILKHDHVTLECIPLLENRYCRLRNKQISKSLMCHT